jgi:hypothetical protein
LQAQPSPTTGTLPFLMATNDKSIMPPAAKITEDSQFDNDVFSFQPHLGSEQTGFSTAEKVISLIVSVYLYFSSFLQCSVIVLFGFLQMPTSPPKYHLFVFCIKYLSIDSCA